MACSNLVCPFHEYDASSGLVTDPGMSCLITDAVKQVRFSKARKVTACSR